MLDEQATDETSALVNEATVTPEVAEELAGESSNPKLEAGSQTIAQNVSSMAASVDDTSVTAVEVVEELTEEEAAERHRLELKVERAFCQAGVALRELRDRRLYRSTHKNFEEYCQDRFGFNRISAHNRIAAVEVFENLFTIGEQIPLPTNERQVRPLTKLKADEQRSCWKEAVEAAGGKVPCGRIVKDIMERRKERDITPPPIPFQEGDVVMIRGMGNPDLRKYNGRWARALRINEYTITVAVDGLDVPVKSQFLEPIDPKYWAEIKTVNERITRLQQMCNLDPMDDAALEVLRRRTCFTQRQMLLLERMEQDYALFVSGV